MPLYEYACPACGREWTAMRRVAARHDEMCCGQPARLLISCPVVQPDLRPYWDDGLGVRVQSRAHRRRVMQTLSVEPVDADTKNLHGTKGTVFSRPGEATRSVPKSGAFREDRPRP